MQTIKLPLRSSSHIGNSLCLCAQLELRDLARGNKVHGRWRPSDPIEVVRLDTKAYQYLYAEGAAHWMHSAVLANKESP